MTSAEGWSLNGEAKQRVVLGVPRMGWVGMARGGRGFGRQPPVLNFLASHHSTRRPCTT